MARWSKRRVVWTVVLTAVATLLLVVLAMNFALPEKKVERKIEFRHPVSDPQFRREMGVLLGPGILSGSSVQVLENGREIFPSMLGAIHAAQKTITFETYIYWSGDIGNRFADALAERARAGVQVKVLLDWAGSLKMDQTVLQRLMDSGADVRHYRPLHWYNLGRLNNRTHRKLLVIDGTVGFTGGVGIADIWKGDAQDPDHWRDLHFRVEGPVVAQMQAAFNDNWIKTVGTVLHGPDYFPPLSPRGNQDAHVFISSPAGGSESMHLMVLMALAAAEKSIDLEAAYFVPDDLSKKAMIAARRRGVRVRIILPGPYTDSESVRLSSRREWGELLAAGVEIYEYQPTMIHSKLLIVDRGMVAVGSTNFDMRSFQLNDEASLNVYEPEFADQMRRIFEKDLKDCRRYTYEKWKQRPWKERFIETVLRPIKSQL